MAATKSVTDIVNIAKACLWLNYKDLNKQKLFSPSGTFRPQDLNLLKFVTRRVDWMNTKSPSYPTLQKTANYLYSLCTGRNAAIAEGILDQQGGNVVYNPITGQVLNGIVLREFTYVVGGAGSPLTNGMTTYTISDTRIIAGTMDLHVDGLELPTDNNDVFSYTVQYSPSTIEIEWNQPLVAGQIVNLEYWVGGANSSGVSVKSVQPTIYYTAVGGETSFAVGALLNIPITDIIFSARATGFKRLVSGATSDMNELQYTASTGTITLPTGDVAITGEVFAFSYMI
jgi:hypothetical protein